MVASEGARRRRHDQGGPLRPAGDRAGHAVRQQLRLPPWPRVPTTTRSASTSAATSRIVGAGSPDRTIRVKHATLPDARSSASTSVIFRSRACRPPDRRRAGPSGTPGSPAGPPPGPAPRATAASRRRRRAAPRAGRAESDPPAPGHHQHGHSAACSTWRLVDPRARAGSAPMPRLPTTASAASSVARRSAARRRDARRGPRRDDARRGDNGGAPGPLDEVGRGPSPRPCRCVGIVPAVKPTDGMDGDDRQVRQSPGAIAQRRASCAGGDPSTPTTIPSPDLCRPLGSRPRGQRRSWRGRAARAESLRRIRRPALSPASWPAQPEGGPDPRPPKSCTGGTRERDPHPRRAERSASTRVDCLRAHPGPDARSC
jgi:hypothetical protein